MHEIRQLVSECLKFKRAGYKDYWNKDITISSIVMFGDKNYKW